MEMAVVPVILRILAEKSPGVTQALSGIRKDFADLGSLVESAKGKMAAFSLATTVGLAGLGSAVLRSAGEFEQLQAKLQSVSRTAEAASENWRNAVQLAANSPFDVKGVVAATTTLEAFGQRSQELLPLVGNLSAAFGKSVEEGALVLGKAFSGSLEGFESLRSTFGISTLQLTKFGAVMTKTGGISVATAGDLAKARDALKGIIQLKYGDAMERQAHTLFGAFSNLQDAITRLGASFGTALIPLATSATRILTSVVEVFEKLPAPIRSFIAIGGVATLGLAAISTAALGLYTIVSKASVPLSILARALNLVSTGAATTAEAMTITVLASQAAGGSAARSSVGVEIFTRAAARATVATFALNTQLTQTGRISLALGPALAPVTAQMLALGRGGGALAAMGTRTVPALASMAQNLQAIVVPAGAASVQLTAATASTSLLSQFAARFMAIPFGAALLAIGVGAGVAFAALNRMTQQNQKLDDSVVQTSRALTESASALRHMREILIQVTGTQERFAQAGGSVKDQMHQLVEEVRRFSPADLTDRFAKAGVSLEDFGNQVKEDQDHLKRYQRQIEELTAAQAEQQAILDRPRRFTRGGIAIDETERKEAETAIAAIKAKILEFQDAIERTKLSILGGNMALDSLKTAAKAYDEAGKSIQKFNAYLQQARNFEGVDSINRALGLTSQKILEVQGLLAAAKLPLGDIVALQERLLTAETDERKIIEEYLGLLQAKDALTKQGAEAESKAIKDRLAKSEQAIEREKQLKGESWVRERKQIQDLLKDDELSTEDKLRLRQRLTTGENEYFHRRVTVARKSFDDEQKVLEQGLESLKNSGTATADQLADQIENVIAKTEAWGIANKALIDKSPELKAALTDAIGSARQELAQTNLEKPKEALEKAMEAVKGFGAEAITTEQKLAAVEQGLAELRGLQESGLITTTRERQKLKEEIKNLTRDELTLQTQLTRETQAQARETAAVKRDTLQTTIELLKARQGLDGKDRSAEIKAKEQELLAGRIQAVRDQEQAEVEMAGSTERAKVEAAARAEARISQIKDEEVLKRIQAEQKVTESVETEAKRQADFLEGLRQRRQGGRNSPIISGEELSAQLSFLGDFAFDSFNMPQTKRPRAPVGPPQGLLDYQSQVEQDIREGGRSGKGGRGRFTDEINAADRASRAPAGDTINNFYMSLAGGRRVDVNDPEDQRAIRHLYDKFGREDDHTQGAG